jgi:hypothetical protein
MGADLTQSDIGGLWPRQCLQAGAAGHDKVQPPGILSLFHGDRCRHGNLFALATFVAITAKNIACDATKAASAGLIKIALNNRLGNNEARILPQFHLAC